MLPALRHHLVDTPDGPRTACGLATWGVERERADGGISVLDCALVDLGSVNCPYCTTPECARPSCAAERGRVARAIDFISARGFSLSHELIMVRGILKGTL